MLNTIMSTQKDLSSFNRPRKVVFYGRVSTEHEEQTYALKNQMQWYDELCKQYPNWSVVDRFVDDGITGTKAKKRPEFMRMMGDAKLGKFDLIVTREVSRFARNTVECLEFTRQLKSLNVEVYFVHESLWTFDSGSEMILTIMAMVAQEESRKMSERVKAGQAISRKNGVLYGNGNILGYDRVGDTYVINPEQAETVRLIYNLYESGMGMQVIRNELIRLGKKNARGTTEWDVTRISRCLHNTVYKGVMAYNKSHSNNFLDQKTIVNRDEDSYMYVAGKFEPIISSEQWERCKHIRESRKKVQAIDVNGQIAIRTIASHKSNDVWANKLRCRCGSSMRKNKWHTRHNGKTSYGYKCYCQLNKGADKVNPNDSSFCNVRAICDWKLEMMAVYVFRHLFKDAKLLSLAAEKLKSESFLEKQERERIRRNYEDKVNAMTDKLRRLIEMRANGEIDKDTYLTMKLKAEADKEQAQQELLLFDRNCDNSGYKNISEKDIKTYLKQFIGVKNTAIDAGLIGKFVTRIQVESETEFSWYIDFDLNSKTDKCTRNTEFTITYKDALKFRIARKEILRENQYKDLKVKICI